MKVSRPNLASFLTLLFAPPCLVPAQEAEPFRLSGDPEIEALIDRLRELIPEQMEQQSVPGTAVALVDVDGLVWAEGFGTTRAGGGRPVDADTMFSLQSISKAVTATAVLAAVRDGLLDLDEPIHRYVPEFTVNSRFEERPERKMTLRHLLSHHAGFTHENRMGNNYDPEYPSFDVYARSISDTWLRYPVGQRYSYSNLGVDLSGFILQTVRDKPFPESVAESVFEPLGMHHSSCDWSVIEETDNRAIGHAEGFENVPLRFGLIPSGGVYASARDLAAFVKFHLDGGRVGERQLLPQPLLDQMQAISFSVPDQPNGYGLGISNHGRYGGRFLNHNGGGFGFATHMSWYPSYGIGVVVLTNRSDGNLSTALPAQIIGSVLHRKLGSVPPERRWFTDLEPVDVDLETRSKLIGSYLGHGMQADIVRRGDTVGLSMQSRFAPLRFLGPTEAFAELGPARNLLRFELGPDGRPVRATLVNDGQSLDYNDGPNDPPGPDLERWGSYEGEYAYSIWGQQTETVRIHRRNGYLYCGDLRLHEHLTGLFFTGAGEALDLRSDLPTWRNIALTGK